MLSARWLVLLVFALILGIPFAFRPESASAPRGAQRLVIITPHGDPIRHEFGLAFDRWHRAGFNQPVTIDWRVPGGTSEIRKQLQAIYTRAIASGQLTPEGDLASADDPMPFDLLFGGGTFEHGQMKRGVKARPPRPPGAEKEVSLSISAPLKYEQAQLDEWFGERTIGAGEVYDKDQFWLGTALSGFGISFNRDVLRRLGLPDPVSWKDLADPRYRSWLALADPRASGSVATTFESILNTHGWDEGWALLRAMSANARYFANSSPKVPIDVGHGEAAAGLAIDYYGRYESQALMKPGDAPETARVGYIDPPGEVFIDPDPISLLRGGPNPEVARRFIEFTLTEEGQALWNFAVRSSAAAITSPERQRGEPDADAPGTLGPVALGPERYELRRMPVRRVMYEKYFDRLVDRVNPYDIASKTKPRGWRDGIGLLMASFSIELHPEQSAAWMALHRARAEGHPRAAEMEQLWLAMPTHTLTVKREDGASETRELPLNEENYKAIAADWAEARKTGRLDSIRVRYMEFFKGQYAEIVRLAAAAPPG